MKYILKVSRMVKDLTFEIGPIRPPSEATSLLLRFTRNCPWNRCEFCHLYKGKKFEIRELEEIKRDIDVVKEIYDDILVRSWREGLGGRFDRDFIDSILVSDEFNECYKQVAVWAYYGARSVFIQDANSLVMPPRDFAFLLNYLREKFPSVRRITSYARAQTIAKRLSVEDLRLLRESGLNRIHIGLESGNEEILKFVKKGVTPSMHIEAGKKVKEAKIELSEYVILGLGGKTHYREHALDTAKVLNEIDPDFIRFRTLKLIKGMPLYDKVLEGKFLIPHEEEILVEERLLLENLDGIKSYVVSDHILNLLEEVEGRLPEEKEKMIGVIDRYFSLSEEERKVFRLGRRLGIFRRLDDLRDELTYFRLKKTIREMEERDPQVLERTLSLLLEHYI